MLYNIILVLQNYMEWKKHDDMILKPIHMKCDFMGNFMWSSHFHIHGNVPWNSHEAMFIDYFMIGAVFSYTFHVYFIATSSGSAYW